MNACQAVQPRFWIHMLPWAFNARTRSEVRCVGLVTRHVYIRVRDPFGIASHINLEHACMNAGSSRCSPRVFRELMRFQLREQFCPEQWGNGWEPGTVGRSMLGRTRNINLKPSEEITTRSNCKSSRHAVFNVKSSDQKHSDVWPRKRVLITDYRVQCTHRLHKNDTTKNPNWHWKAVTIDEYVNLPIPTVHNI